MSATQLSSTQVRLTTEEFHSTVLAHEPQVAVFDCDGTLWDGDAGYGFMLWSIETGLVSRNASDWIDSGIGYIARGKSRSAASAVK